MTKNQAEHSSDGHRFPAIGFTSKALEQGMSLAATYGRGGDRKGAMW